MLKLLILCISISCSVLIAILPQNCYSETSTPKNEQPQFKLLNAYVCEDVEEGIPSNRSVAFSVSIESICCYTLFDEIREDSSIYHRWLFHDKPVAKFKLFLKAPRWATYSSIQLREADKGPWRVEIRDSNNRLLKTIRFSIVD